MTPRAAWSRWELVGLLAFAALVGVLGWRLGWRERGEAKGDTRFYRRGAARYLAGEHLYVDPSHAPTGPAGYVPTTGYTYLPPFAVACAWMVPLPYPAVRVVWLLLMAGCALGTLLLVARWAAPRGPPPRLALALALVLVLRFWINDLAHGQVNHLVTLLLVGALVGAAEGREAAGGVALGLALAIKPTAWLLVPWFLLTGRPRLGATAAATLVVAVALPAARYGPEAYLGLLADWAARMSAFASEAAPDPGNASLAAALERSGVSRGLARAGAMAAVGAGFLALLSRPAARGSRAGAAAVLVLGALLSPVTWKAHLVVLLAPLTLLARDALETREATRAAAGGVCALLGVVLVLPSRGLLDLGVVEAWGGPSLGLALLFVWLASRAGAWSDASPREGACSTSTTAGTTSTPRTSP